jgi:Protein of unknown function (DUF2490)
VLPGLDLVAALFEFLVTVGTKLRADNALSARVIEFISRTGFLVLALRLHCDCEANRYSDRSLSSPNSHVLRTTGLLLLLLLLFCGPANAQTLQFLPEVDVYSKIHPDLRFSFQAKETREVGDPTQAEIGPGFDFFLKPMVRLRDTSAFDLDDAKPRPLKLSVGFRYVPSADKPHVERMVLEATLRYPLVARIVFTDRNRADLDWSNNQFTWRYRNRLTFERRISIASYHPAPYVSAEFYYESQYQKWTTTALYAGCLFPAGRHLEFNAYYDHQNITSKKPNKQLNQLGLVLNLYF